MARPVIVGVDDPASAGPAVDWAADEARARGMRLHLVHAWEWEPHQDPDPADAEASRQAGSQTLRELVERAVARHQDLDVSSALLDASPRDTLIELATQAGLLVVGSRGTGGFHELLVGSTTLHVAARAACPVVVVRAPDLLATDGVAVGVEAREPDEGVLRFAFETAGRRGLPLRAVHAWSYPLLLGPGHSMPPVYESGHVAAEEQRLLSEVMAGWQQKYPEVPVEEDAVRSGAAKQLVALSKTHQLVVVGRHRRSDSLFGRLGSVSQAVVHHAHCPVAVVPSA
ncbi:universal stress protein [Kitasatospora sp. NPDC094015]|uniref:universal stress protein n=1 Tax=Kitasatospora sp. NPDC094015 TaxID=3155205 RepID=UPI00331A8D1F